MTFETIIGMANVAALLLSAAAIALAFYVRMTAADLTTKCCDRLKTAIDADLKTMKVEIDTDVKTVATAAETVKRELHTEISSATKGLYDRINGFGDRLHELENKVDDTARRADLWELTRQLGSISGEMKAIMVRVESIAESSQMNSAALKRVENHLFQIQGQ